MNAMPSALTVNSRYLGAMLASNSGTCFAEMQGVPFELRHSGLFSRCHPSNSFGRGFRQRERDDAAAGWTTRFRSSGGDHHKLAAVDPISARAGIAAKGQGGLPEDLARVLVKRPKGFVRGSADENQAARRHQRSAIVFRARGRDPRAFNFG